MFPLLGSSRSTRARWARGGTVHARVECTRAQGRPGVDSPADLVGALSDGITPVDLDFVGRYPGSAAACVAAALDAARGAEIISRTSYDQRRWAEVEAAARRYDHGSYTTCIYPEEGRLLFALTEILAPRSAIVLGSYYGYWAHFLLAGLAASGGAAVLVDPDEGCQAVARRNVTSYGFTGLAEIAVTAGEPYLSASQRMFDLVVLDADGPEDDSDPTRRRKGIYASLLRSVLPRMAPRGVLVCHNLLLSGPPEAPALATLAALTAAELGPFLGMVERDLPRFIAVATTQGVGIGRR